MSDNGPDNTSTNDKIISELTKVLNENNVNNALICFVSEPDEPVVFYRGEFYKIAKISCDVANTFKKKVLDDLDIK